MRDGEWGMVLGSGEGQSGMGEWGVGKGMQVGKGRLFFSIGK